MFDEGELLGRDHPATRANHVRSIDTLTENIRMLEYRLRAAGRPLP
jgi:hypothetical protein